MKEMRKPPIKERHLYCKPPSKYGKWLSGSAGLFVFFSLMVGWLGKPNATAGAQSTNDIIGGGIDSGLSRAGLPIDQWLDHATVVSDTSAEVFSIGLGNTGGFFDTQAFLTNVMGFLNNFMYTIIATIWNLTYGIVAAAFSLDFLRVSYQFVDRIASMVGGILFRTGAIWVIAVFVLVYIFMLVAKGATTSIFKTALSSLIPLGLFMFVVAGAQANFDSGLYDANNLVPVSEEGGEEQADRVKRAELGSPSWIMDRANTLSLLPLQLTQGFTAGCEAGNVEGAASEVLCDPIFSNPNSQAFFGPHPNDRNYGSCAYYVESMHSRYRQLSGINSPQVGASKVTALARSHVSSLWERAVLIPYIDNEYGDRNNFGKMVFCHHLESRAGTPRQERWINFRNAFSEQAFGTVIEGDNVPNAVLERLPGAVPIYGEVTLQNRSDALGQLFAFLTSHPEWGAIKNFNSEFADDDPEVHLWEDGTIQFERCFNVTMNNLRGDEARFFSHDWSEPTKRTSAHYVDNCYTRLEPDFYDREDFRRAPQQGEGMSAQPRENILYRGELKWEDLFLDNTNPGLAESPIALIAREGSRDFIGSLNAPPIADLLRRDAPDGIFRIVCDTFKGGKENLENSGASRTGDPVIVGCDKYGGNTSVSGSDTGSISVKEGIGGEKFFWAGGHSIQRDCEAVAGGSVTSERGCEEAKENEAINIADPNLCLPDEGQEAYAFTRAALSNAHNSCGEGTQPLNLLHTISSLPAADPAEALIPFAWCRWDRGNVRPQDRFQGVIPPGIDGETAFGDLGGRVSSEINRGDMREGFGLSTFQACNQWWDMGNRKPSQDPEGAERGGFFLSLFSLQNDNRLRQDEAAENFISSFGKTASPVRFIITILLLVVSIVYFFALGALAFALLLAQLQVVVAFALVPAFLFLMAIPHPKAKGASKIMLRMMITGLLAKAFASFILGVMIISILALSLLIENAFSDFIRGGPLETLWTAVVPLFVLLGFRKIPGLKNMLTFKGAISGAKARVQSALGGQGGVMGSKGNRGKNLGLSNTKGANRFGRSGNKLLSRENTGLAASERIRNRKTKKSTRGKQSKEEQKTLPVAGQAGQGGNSGPINIQNANSAAGGAGGAALAQAAATGQAGRGAQLDKLVANTKSATVNTPKGVVLPNVVANPQEYGKGKGPGPTEEQMEKRKAEVKGQSNELRRGVEKIREPGTSHGEAARTQRAAVNAARNLQRPDQVAQEAGMLGEAAAAIADAGSNPTEANAGVKDSQKTEQARPPVNPDDNYDDGFGAPGSSTEVPIPTYITEYSESEYERRSVTIGSGGGGGYTFNVSNNSGGNGGSGETQWKKDLAAAKQDAVQERYAERRRREARLDQRIGGDSVDSASRPNSGGGGLTGNNSGDSLI